MSEEVYYITPVPKPRMTRRDKWMNPPRPPVARYFAFSEEVRIRRVNVPESGYHIIFVLPMPKSWSKKKRREMDGKPHRKKPDKDNLEKALLDALFDDDSHIWSGCVSKIWGEQGMLIVRTGCEVF